MSSLIVIPKTLVSGRNAIERVIRWRASDIHRSFEVEETDDWIIAASHRTDAPLGGPRLHRKGDWTVCFAGDLVDFQTVPFDRIVSTLKSGDYEFLSELSGVFALVAYDSKAKRLYVISDRRSQKPIFFSLRDRGLCVATDLGHFTRLPGEWQFNRRWLWELVYLNFPVDSTTFLKGVERCESATVLSYDHQSRNISIETYINLLRPRKPLLSGTKAMEFASEIFSDRFARHFNGASNIACALTGGWDGRTVLALAPAKSNVTAYTYGGPGCVDLENAKSTAGKIGVDHIAIPFDDEFVRNLPFHAFETVYRSGGLQGILRSTLHYAYSVLTDHGSRFPLVLSGIALGTALRGSAQYPDLVSMPLADRFRGLPPASSEEEWRELFEADYSKFAEWIEAKLEGLKTRFGPFDTGAHHLAYVIYPGSTSYFAGEVQLSDNFTTLRVPMWDTKVLDALFSIEPTTISFSHFLTRSERVRRKEMLLQAYLLCRRAPAFRHILVRTNRPSAVLAGEIPYQLDRIVNGIHQRIKYRSVAAKPPPLEDWNRWLFNCNRDFVMDLVQSSDTLIGDFVSSKIIDSAIAKQNMRLLGKLLTAEIILRLIRNRWQRFW